MAVDPAEFSAAKAAAQGIYKSKSQEFSAETRYASIRSSLSAALQKLASPESTAKVLRSAAHAGAIVIYNELQLKVPVDKGVLKGSLYRWHDDDASSQKRQVYLVGPNKKKAGHWANVEYGHFRYNKPLGKGRWAKSRKIEPRVTTSVKGIGHGGPGALPVPVFVPPHPYLRPAWEAQKKNVVKAMSKRAAERIRELMAGKE